MRNWHLSLPLNVFSHRMEFSVITSHSTLPLEKGIANRELARNHLARMKVFGIESRAPSFQGSGNDQRIIDVVNVLLRNLECRFVDFHGDGSGEGHRTRKASNASV